MDKDGNLLIKRLIKGDEKAYNIIFKQYYKSLCVFVSHYSDLLESEEIVQEVMLWLWENRKTLPQDLSIKAFLFSAVKNKCINKIIHKRIQNKVLGEMLNQYEHFFSVDDEYERYERKELIALLHKTLNELPEDYREVFDMNRFQNMTYSEIALEKGVSPKTVAYRISQTLKKLRVVFKDYLTTVILFF